MEKNRYKTAILLAQLSCYIGLFLGILNFVLVFVSRSIAKSIPPLTLEDELDLKRIKSMTNVGIALAIAPSIIGIVLGVYFAIVLKQNFDGSVYR